jgi:hypothetical protein
MEVVLSEVVLACRFLVAAAFFFAAIGKIVDHDGSLRAVQELGVPKPLARPLAGLLPYMESCIAVALLIDDVYQIAALASFVLSASFLVALIANLIAGRRPRCHCFGQIDEAPIGAKAVVRIVLLTALAAVAAFGSEYDAFASINMTGLVPPEHRSWFMGTIALTGYSGFLTWLALHLLSRQLRLSRRIAALEAGNDSAHQGERSGKVALGLPVDAPAPNFTLNDLNGIAVSLQDLLARGHSLVVIFMDPDCEACATLLPEVEKWQIELRPATDVIVISRGTVGENLAMFGSRPISNVLIERVREVSHAFRCPATPAAVWISGDGSVASSLAMGPTGIKTLVKAISADNSLSANSPIEPVRLVR